MYLSSYLIIQNLHICMPLVQSVSHPLTIHSSIFAKLMVSGVVRPRQQGPWPGAWLSSSLLNVAILALQLLQQMYLLGLIWVQPSPGCATAYSSTTSLGTFVNILRLFNFTLPISFLLFFQYHVVKKPRWIQIMYPIYINICSLLTLILSTCNYVNSSCHHAYQKTHLSIHFSQHAKSSTIAYVVTTVTFYSYSG